MEAGVRGRAGEFAPQQTAWRERAVCGAAACAGGRFAFLKDRRRPVFEGQWGCSAACLEAMVQAAVKREAGEDGGMAGGEHRHRVPLGLILLEQGWITREQLQRALERQRTAGAGRIGWWLMEECGVDAEVVLRGLGLQWGCLMLRLEEFDAEAMALAAPRLLVDAMGMIPLREAGRRLYVAFADRPDAAAAFALERMSGLKVESGLMERSQWETARQRLRGSGFVAAEFERAGRTDELAAKVAAELRRMQPRASRLVRVHQMYWLRMWLEMGAVRAGGGLPRSREDVADRIYAVGGVQ